MLARYVRYVRYRTYVPPYGSAHSLAVGSTVRQLLRSSILEIRSCGIVGIKHLASIVHV
jgi:hypothetical protein